MKQVNKIFSYHISRLMCVCVCVCVPACVRCRRSGGSIPGHRKCPPDRSLPCDPQPPASESGCRAARTGWTRPCCGSDWTTPQKDRTSVMQVLGRQRYLVLVIPTYDSCATPRRIEVYWAGSLLFPGSSPSEGTSTGLWCHNLENKWRNCRRRGDSLQVE